MPWEYEIDHERILPNLEYLLRGIAWYGNKKTGNMRIFMNGEFKDEYSGKLLAKMNPFMFFGKILIFKKEDKVVIETENQVVLFPILEEITGYFEIDENGNEHEITREEINEKRKNIG